MTYALEIQIEDNGPNCGTPLTLASAARSKRSSNALKPNLPSSLRSKTDAWRPSRRSERYTCKTIPNLGTRLCGKRTGRGLCVAILLVDRGH